MLEFKIESEEPPIHWPNINVKQKNVLDLGCGRWGETNLNNTTPYYFLNQGASHLLGIDSSVDEVKYFKSLKWQNTSFFAENIKGSNLIKTIIKQNNINVIKSDIEGRELLFLDFNEYDMQSVESLYVEYHGQHIKELLENKFQQLGFVIYQIGHLWIDGFGVLFCNKKI